MLTVEKRFLNFLTKKKFIIVLAILVAASLVLRQFLLDYLSSDMEYFLLPWMQQIEQGGGIYALQEPIGNYNIAYLLVLVLLQKLPMDPMLAIKSFSILADYLMAFVIGLIVYQLRGPSAGARKWAWLSAVLTTLLPLPMLNSALWGQCDSVYTLFLVLAVWLVLKERWTLSFLMLGLGFAFKLQALFLLPLFIILYIAKRRFSLLNFFLLPLPLFLTSLPSAIPMGNYMLAYDIYKGQAVGDDRLFNDYFNLSVMFNNLDPAIMKNFLVSVTILACFAMLALIWGKNYRVEGENVVLLGAWSVLTCVMLLPNMHERYGFAGEVLLWVWFIARPSVRRLVPCAVFSLSALSAYFSFLGGYWVFDVNTLSLLNMVTYALLTYMLMMDLKSDTTRINGALHKHTRRSTP